MNPEISVVEHGRMGWLRTTGARLGMSVLAAVGGSFLAIEGGAAVGHDIPGVAAEAEAGTGITGLIISSAGCDANAQPSLVINNQRGTEAHATLTDKTTGEVYTDLIIFTGRTTYPFPRGSVVQTKIAEEPKQVDTETVCGSAVTTTSTLATTTTMPARGTTSTTEAATTTSTPAATTTTTTLRTTSTISPAVTNSSSSTVPASSEVTVVSSTTTTLDVGFEQQAGGPDPLVAGQSTAVDQARPNAELARSGTDAMDKAVLAVVTALGGALLLALGLRKKHQQEA